MADNQHPWSALWDALETARNVWQAFIFPGIVGSWGAYKWFAVVRARRETEANKEKDNLAAFNLQERKQISEESQGWIKQQSSRIREQEIRIRELEAELHACTHKIDNSRRAAEMARAIADDARRQAGLPDHAWPDWPWETK